MRAIRLLKRCVHCNKHLTLIDVDSILVEKCLECGAESQKLAGLTDTPEEDTGKDTDPPVEKIKKRPKKRVLKKAKVKK